jgi:lysophospholipase L1-like esterase
MQRVSGAFRTLVVVGLLATVGPAVGAEDGDVVERVVATLAPIAFPTTPPNLSADCRTVRVAGDQFRRPLRGLRKAIRENRQPRVLAIGSSSTAGVGATRPSNTYTARLEQNLEDTFLGRDFDVVGRGIGGEVAEGQSARMKDTVLEVKPDLVLWQVGTNDALRKVDLATFKDCLRRTLTWLRQNNIDVVLVDPQYGASLTQDASYAETVEAIAEVAGEQRVLLVDRFEAMRELVAKRGDQFYLAADNLHLNDVGHRCMAEQLARAIVAGVLLAEADGPTAQQAPAQ